MNNKKSFPWIKLGILLFFVMSVVACGSKQPPATATTALTDMPEPTATSTRPVSTPTSWAVPRATMNPTEKLPEAIDTSKPPIDEAIAADLEELGYDWQEGELAWSTRNPLVLRANEQDSPLSDLRATNPIFENFILSMDIEWGEFSEGSIGGCGIAFHAQDNFRGETILFRIQHQPVFNSWNLEHWNNGYQGSLLGEGSIHKDGVYEDAIGPGKNHYVLVVEEETITVYANGKEIGSASLPPGLRDGRIGAFPWAVAGASVCSFTEGWVWRLP